jgi:DDRGK domain-containing protein 1
LTKFSSILESPKPQQQQQAPPRAELVRNQRRNRVRAAEPQAQQAPAARDDSDEEPTGVEFDEKMGAKKRAKLEAKAEKRAQREAELKAREEQKKRDGNLKIKVEIVEI